MTISFESIQAYFSTEIAHYRHRLEITEANLIAGTRLLSRIALEKERRTEEPSSLQSAYKGSSTEGTTEKVQKLGTYPIYKFVNICKSNFPFSSLPPDRSKTALQNALNTTQPILFHYLTIDSSEWLSEETLNESFLGLLQQVTSDEIKETCIALALAYLKPTDRDIRAGYYLLWIIKQLSGASYTIPPKKDFDSDTVTKILSSLIKPDSTDTIRNRTQLFDILHFESLELPRKHTYLYENLLTQVDQTVFIDSLIVALTDIPMNLWQNKSYHIINLLSRIDPEKQAYVLHCLESNLDDATQEIGSLLASALRAKSLNESLPHIYALQEKAPDFNERAIEKIFRFPFKKFTQKLSDDKGEPEFVRCLSHDLRGRLFIDDSIFILDYHITGHTGKKSIPKHLLAYDSRTEKLVWALPMIAPALEGFSPDTTEDSSETDCPATGGFRYDLKKIGNYIALNFPGNTIQFINPTTGEFVRNITVPPLGKYSYLSLNSDCMHITPDDTLYLTREEAYKKILIGGKIRDDVWQPSFEIKIHDKNLKKLSTHCGFISKDSHFTKNPSFSVTNSIGAQVTFENYIDSLAKDNKLYLLQQDPLDPHKSILTIRTLKDDATVVSEVETSLSLNGSTACFGKLCDNGMLILFNNSDPDSDKNPKIIFVNVHDGRITYSDHTIMHSPRYHRDYGIHKLKDSYIYVIDKNSGEVWTWDHTTENLWKISSEGANLMGKLERICSQSVPKLKHVDASGRLYITY